MTTRAIVLLAVGCATLLLLGLYSLFRHRSGGNVPERLDIGDLDLELMQGCCAFVVFTTASCRPCKAALHVVQSAAERSGGLTEVVTVDAMAEPATAIRYDVTTVPTVFLITASGHVIRRWRDVPPPAEVTAELARL